MKLTHFKKEFKSSTQKEGRNKNHRRESEGERGRKREKRNKKRLKIPIFDKTSKVRSNEF